MSKNKFKIVGLGEILWDVLPSGRQIGGAPSNFAYISTQLGDHGIIASAVGDDAEGREILQALDEKSVDISYIQKNPKYPTGKVEVSLYEGQAVYEIKDDVAWDYLELEENWKQLASETDAVSFGSLAQRNTASRETIRQFIELVNKNTLLILDINLRQENILMEVLIESLKLANVAKLNDAELPLICELFEISGKNEIEQVKNLRKDYDLDTVCLTRGEKGSLLVTKNEISECPGIEIQIKDTVGAGDAFTAGVTHGLLRNWSLEKTNEYANKLGAFVSSQTGAMPSFENFNAT